LAAGGYDGIARYELGDAMETIDRADGPFDIVLIDHQKDRYADAFEAVRSKVPVGGVVVADNAITASVLDFEDLLEWAEGGAPVDCTDTRRGHRLPRDGSCRSGLRDGHRPAGRRNCRQLSSRVI